MSQQWRRKPGNRKPPQISARHKPPARWPGDPENPFSLRQLRDISKVLELVAGHFPMPGLATDYMYAAMRHSLLENVISGDPHQWRVTDKGHALIEVFAKMKRGAPQRAALLLLGFNLEEEKT